jgi:hypothetical protein
MPALKSFIKRCFPSSVINDSRQLPLKLFHINQRVFRPHQYGVDMEAFFPVFLKAANRSLVSGRVAGMIKQLIL